MNPPPTPALDLVVEALEEAYRDAAMQCSHDFDGAARALLQKLDALRAESGLAATLKAKGFQPPPEKEPCKHGNDYHHCRQCDNEFDEEMS